MSDEIVLHVRVLKSDLEKLDAEAKRVGKKLGLPAPSRADMVRRWIQGLHGGPRHSHGPAR